VKYIIEMSKLRNLP